jgi:OOP family OmpA-OmpF porin
MLAVRIVLVLLLLLPHSVQAANLKDHPAVTAYPGSVLTRRDEDGFRPYTIVVGVNPDGKTDETAFKTLAPSGNVTRLAYENAKDRSALEIFTNYKEGLANGGYDILFSCTAADCGPPYAISRWNRVTGLRYTGRDMGYLAAHGKKGDKEIYVVVVVAKVRHQVEVIEVAAMEKGLVTADVIAKGLINEGRVVLTGIFFDVDKAVIKPESEPALREIAAFLNASAEVKAFITGHTDSSGSFDHNMKLSRDRAAAVVKALVSDHGIAASRMAAHGVGPLSPLQSNNTEEGRAENRRVEMVEQTPE